MTRKFNGVILLSFSAFAALPVAASSNEALLRALVENGYLTEAQAKEIQAESRVDVAPKSSNVEEIRIRGRIQGQFAYSDGKDADEYSTMELRRVRLGVEGKLFQDYLFNVEINALPDDVSLRSAFVTWNKFDAANVTFGYDKPRFGFDENTSSASIKTVERSLISNRIVPGERTGLRVHGEFGWFNYYTGIYNHTDDGASNPGGADDYLYNVSGEVKLDDTFETLSKLRLRADWIGNESDPAGYAFDNAYSVSVLTGAGPAELRAEYIWAKDFNGDDTRGWYVTPSYFVVPEKFEVVGRFESSRSDATNVLRHNRYAVRVPRLDVSTTGDKYEALYFGVNYYIRGNDLKYMMGVEFAELEDSEADAKSETTTGYGALRMQF